MINNKETNKYRPSQDEESNYSSSYSSFFKTDTTSGSNDDSNNADLQKDDSKDQVKQYTYFTFFSSCILTTVSHVYRAILMANNDILLENVIHRG